ncbi:exodeoxyribonuclease VII small subunit [Bdellovibrionota bacterium FG-2]
MENENPKKDEVTMSFEQSLALLQDTVKKLESGELSLEDALQKFEDGVKLTRACESYLAAAEKRVELLTKDASGNPELKPFSANIRT